MHIQDAVYSFPGIEKSLDVEFMKGLIKNSFKKRRKDLSLENLDIADVKFEPGRQCVILYRTKLTDRYFRKSWEQLFLGRVLMKDESPPTLPDEAFYAEEPGIILSPFPHDPVMPWLPNVNDKKYMRGKLCTLIDKRRYKIRDLSVSLLAYTPMMRATFLYKIQLQDKASGSTDHWEWIGKTNHYKPSQRVFANYWALWKAGRDRIPMPKPQGFLFLPQMTFQERIKGKRLGGMVDHPDLPEMLRNAAKLIASFHSLSIPISNVRGLDQEVKNLNRWSDVVMNLRPDLKMRMEELRREIVANMETSFRAEGPIHADFHHTNLLVEGTHVQLIDMDEMAIGDPCVDIGRFLSSLRIPSLRTFGSFEGLKSQRELFLEEYLTHSKKDVRKVRLFEAASLFTSAASAFRLQRQNWEEEVAWLLEEAESAFQEAKKGKPFATALKAGKFLPSEGDKLLFAKDEVYMKALLALPVFQKSRREIVSCELLSQKSKTDYEQLTYRVASVAERKRVKEKVDIFIRPGHGGRSQFCYIDFLSKKLENTDAAKMFPQPVGHLQELGAFAFYRKSGKSLLNIVGREEGLRAAECLAKGLALFHHIEVEPEDCNLMTIQGLKRNTRRKAKGLEDNRALGRVLELKDKILEKKNNAPLKLSYTLSSISPAKVKFGPEGVHLQFPIRKYVGHPFSDIGGFLAKMLAMGKRRKKFSEYNEFVQCFSEHYCECYGRGSSGDLFLFVAEALMDEAVKMGNGESPGSVAGELACEAERLMEDRFIPG